MASPAQDDIAQNRRSDVHQVMTAQVDAGPAEDSLEGETHGPQCPQCAGMCNGTSGGREAVGTVREGRAGPRGTPQPEALVPGQQCASIYGTMGSAVGLANGAMVPMVGGARPVSSSEMAILERW